MAESDEPETWGDFQSMHAAYNRNRKQWAGIGPVFSAEDAYTGIDFGEPLTGTSPVASHILGTC